ncbi:MAG TPA: hypothetical protein ENF19_02700 [Candidatus Bathyarchaeota archaeon]|nr:hypothetical protein [Candidatus Bathyarchaeota archaeon]
MSPRHCAFIPTRVCPIDVDEIPLDVCQLCIEAWKTSADIQHLTGANVLAPTLTVPAGELLQAIPTAPTATPQPRQPPTIDLTETITQQADAMARQVELLKTLDKEFTEDKISPEEYVAKRREIVDQITRASNKPTLLNRAIEHGFLSPEDVESGSTRGEWFKTVTLPQQPPQPKQLKLLLLKQKNKKITVRKHPKEFSLPPTVTSETLKALYQLHDKLGSEEEQILVNLKEAKLGLLKRSQDTILGFLLGQDEKPEDYMAEINQLLDTVEKENDLLTALKKHVAASSNKKPEKTRQLH